MFVEKQNYSVLVLISCHARHPTHSYTHIIYDRSELPTEMSISALPLSDQVFTVHNLQRVPKMRLT